MKMPSETIVFFGSGPVAAASLIALAEDFKIEAVITKDAPSHHRGAVPVIDLSKKMGIPYHTPADKTQLSSLFSNNQFKSKLGVVVDYGIIIAKDVIDYFSLGIVNSHFSLLPLWRGADPISFTILSGEKKAGVSLMLINERLDEGMLLDQRSIQLTPTVTTPELTDMLVDLSNKLIREIIPKYIKGDIKPFAQPPKTPTYSRKLTKEDGRIDWSKSATQLEREVRAFISWPKSQTNLGEIPVIVTSCHVVNESGPAGHIKFSDKKLLVYCGKDALAIDRLKPAGKTDMSSQEFLAGYSQKLAPLK